MFEKVNPAHPDKIADRIAGALVDIVYRTARCPKIAVEVLIGHGTCTIIAESSAHIPLGEIAAVVRRIAGKNVDVHYTLVPQDERLAANQQGRVRCGDNGIFRGMPVTKEQECLTHFARKMYTKYGSDGKYILDLERRFIVCQSGTDGAEIRACYPTAQVNPLGFWTGGTDVDSGAVNRKLGSDMGDSVTGGGLHGKDLSKADVSVNIYAWLKAQKTGKPVELCCAIGDETVDGRPYGEIVRIARDYIRSLGGFEAFAEWGLIR